MVGPLLPLGVARVSTSQGGSTAKVSTSLAVYGFKRPKRRKAQAAPLDAIERAIDHNRAVLTDG